MRVEQELLCGVRITHQNVRAFALFNVVLLVTLTHFYGDGKLPGFGGNGCRDPELLLLSRGLGQTEVLVCFYAC